MRFTKMHGAGNDYVYVNCFAEEINGDRAELARQVSDRHFGVGGDGLILILPPDDTNAADARMQMFNADGSEAEMCGNGIRCVAKYVYDHGIKRDHSLKIQTGAGVLSLELETSNGKAHRVRVDMGAPILDASRIPTTLASSSSPYGDAVINAELEVDGQTFRATSVSMGNPHCVIFVDKATDELVLGTGPKIESSSSFPARVNVEFIELINRGELRQRTWERGSGETYACGTGASAVCVAGVLTERTDRQVIIHLLGGDLELEWNESDGHVYMTGPAEEVFTGVWPR